MFKILSITQNDDQANHFNLIKNCQHKFEWLAVDWNGKIWVYQTKPYFTKSSGQWLCSSIISITKCIGTCKYEGNWQDSLRRIKT